MVHKISPLNSVVEPSANVFTLICVICILVSSQKGRGPFSPLITPADALPHVQWTDQTYCLGSCQKTQVLLICAF